jgi:hypothetical protein
MFCNLRFHGGIDECTDCLVAELVDPAAPAAGCRRTRRSALLVLLLLHDRSGSNIVGFKENGYCGSSGQSLQGHWRRSGKGSQLYEYGNRQDSARCQKIRVGLVQVLQKDERRHLLESRWQYHHLIERQ